MTGRAPWRCGTRRTVAVALALLAVCAGACALVQTNAPAPSLDGRGGGLIAFYTNRDGNTEIYVMNADGSEPTRITDDPGFDDSPALSPDGSRIAFLTSRHDPQPQFPDLKYEIYVVDVDGGSLRRLTTTDVGEDHPAWSPDGGQILFDADYDGDGLFEIYVVDAGGGNPTRLTSNEANDQFADWSPDGTRIAFASDRTGLWQLFVMDADGSNQRQLVSSAQMNLFPAWSPDGQEIAFVSLVPRTRNTDVMVVSAEGGAVRQLTDSAGYDENPAWSPDGMQIAFQTDRDGHFEIDVMSRDGGEQRPLIRNAADDLWPSWVGAPGPQ